ncbi:hypothetical protein HD593_002732 [Nonomuraea rubra]|uniref:Uncharacterized protein n=1 Tax=Nonomuraea rubra TaxID=46180 RepID=A0A7X0TXU5_9ACTN|nr:hypothetical protein [Nonomuraea rubra]
MALGETRFAGSRRAPIDVTRPAYGANPAGDLSAGRERTGRMRIYARRGGRRSAERPEIGGPSGGAPEDPRAVPARRAKIRGRRGKDPPVAPACLPTPGSASVPCSVAAGRRLSSLATSAAPRTCQPGPAARRDRTTARAPHATWQPPSASRPRAASRLLEAPIWRTWFLRHRRSETYVRFVGVTARRPARLAPAHSSRRERLRRWGRIRAPAARGRAPLWPTSLRECPHSRAFRILYRPPTIGKRSAHRREPRSIVRHGAV